MSRLDDELDRRRRRGHNPVALHQLTAVLAGIGYRLDRALDCRSDNRYLSGPDMGRSYPAVNACIVEADTGLSFANVMARRDDNFRRLQELRFSGELFAVVRGRIFEL